jgi:glycine cleavage system T protein
MSKEKTMSEAIEQTVSTTPLQNVQAARGALFSRFFGWEMAESFGSPEQEHEAVRRSAGLLDLSFCGAIHIGGKEGAQFLQGLVTNDVKALSEGKGMRAAFLTGKGKVMGLCRVFGLGNGEFLIITEPQTHTRVYNYVFPMSYAGDFKVTDVSDQYRLLSVQGPRSLLVMKEVCFEPLPQLAEHEWIRTLIAGHQVVVASALHTGETGYDILVPESGLSDTWDFLLLKGEFHSLAPVGQLALDALRIEAGIPVYGRDFDDSNMMLETGLADAVSFTKGCYTGQEAVAMATYRGHVSKRISGLRISSDVVPSHDDRVTKDGKEIGIVTSALRSHGLDDVIALALLKYGFLDPGTTVEVESQGESLPALVVELPFFRND